MTIDLLPGRGVRLPAPLPELGFGLTETAVRALLAPHGGLLPDGVRNTFVCGCSWALAFQLPGVSVTLCADDRDRLRSVTVGRNPSDDRPVCPVGYRGIDLLGWPALELVEALRAEGLPVPDPIRGTLHHHPLHLSCHHPPGRPSAPRGSSAAWGPSAPGRKPRHEGPFSFDVVSLYQATEGNDDTAADDDTGATR
ncbi:hypothetical protein GCM10018790_51880 [Kitasatospora xanthocidica]|uniref:hypothetical protein n=1 Tax=Kitasatospora xanthocidica TaxID=83382 RepID=UPI001678F0ED|nr:hypothetical protein [Kitasatospora xanthocidica]GHF67543.1 hypothetical protein GCM10018790_51880 [Kitasatospora xanthocidica]